jgi:hypothetical protein
LLYPLPWCLLICMDDAFPVLVWRILLFSCAIYYRTLNPWWHLRANKHRDQRILSPSSRVLGRSNTK